MAWKHFRITGLIVRGSYQWQVDYPHKETIIWSFDVLLVLSLNKLMNKQSTCQWFETLWCLWEIIIMDLDIHPYLNTLRLRENGCHFTDDTFKLIFLNENVRISIKILMKFVPMGPINNIPALVQIMAWHHPGNKPLSEPMMVSLLTHIRATSSPSATYMHQWIRSALVQIMACRLFGAKPLSEPVLGYCQ